MGCLEIANCLLMPNHTNHWKNLANYLIVFIRFRNGWWLTMLVNLGRFKIISWYHNAELVGGVVF